MMSNIEFHFPCHNSIRQFFILTFVIIQPVLIGQPIKIMPLGDSITFGIGDDSSSGYRKYLYKDLINSGYNIDFVGSETDGIGNDYDRDHEGHSGWHAKINSNQAESIFHHLEDYLIVDPQIILLHLGTNDITPGPLTTIYQEGLEVADEVVELLDMIYDHNPDIITIVAKIVDRNDSFEHRHLRTIDFNNALESKVDSLLDIPDRNQEIRMVDMYDALGIYWGNPGNPNFADPVHPSDNGYRLMADEWFDALVPILPPTGIQVNIKAFLQGPYNSGSMSIALKEGGHLPRMDPYSVGESIGSLPSMNIVDWVLVELRNSTTTIEAVRAAFLINDGSIVDLDGSSPLSFTGVSAGNYYIVIKHRNHLAVMSAARVELTDIVSTYDFTNSSTKYYGTGGAVLLEPGVWGMIAGDGNSDGIVKYNGSNNDKNSILGEVGLLTPNNVVSGYSNNDINMDGLTKYNGSSNDKNKILEIVGLITPNEIKQTKVP